MNPRSGGKSLGGTLAVAGLLASIIGLAGAKADAMDGTSVGTLPKVFGFGGLAALVIGMVVFTAGNTTQNGTGMQWSAGDGR